MLAFSGRVIFRRLGSKKSSDCAARVLFSTNNIGAWPRSLLSSFRTTGGLKSACRQYSAASTSTKANAKKASTTGKSATKKTTNTKKASKKSKKATKAKAKPKKLTEAQKEKVDAKKYREKTSALKTVALHGAEPKELPSTAPSVMLVEIAKPGMKAVDAMREAHARYKQLTPEELEVRL
jgi:hypothetical protein